MYLRPRQIFEKFIIEEKINRLDERGSQKIDFKPNGIIFGVVTRADQSEMEKLGTLHHDVTHKIVQRGGSAKAKVGDRLIGGEKNFLVQAVDNPAGIGQWFCYYVTERFDLN